MLEIKDKMVLKVNLADEESTKEWAEDLISKQEYITLGFSSLSHNIVFTNKRIIIMSSSIKTKKKDYTTFPYRSISYYSIDTEGLLTNSTGLDFYVSNFGLIRIQFNKEVDIRDIGKLMIEHMVN